MNSDFVKLLGGLNASQIKGNSLSVGQFGDVALITGDGTIKYCNLRKGVDSVEFCELQVDGINHEDLLQFTHVEFSADNSMLLFWSSFKVGVIEIPSHLLKGERALAADHTERCSFSHIYENSGENIEVVSKIVKASFHTLNQQHIVVLEDVGNLRIIDARDVNNSMKVALPKGPKFSSFCFGPSLDWLKFTVFLLSNKGVYAVCPIIPDGTLVHKQVINDLWAWVDSQARRLDRSSTAHHRVYVDAVKAYLLRSVGPPCDSSDTTSGNPFVRAGEATARDSLESPLYQLYDQEDPSGSHSLLVQGPLDMDRRAAAPQESNALANDICVPVVRTVEGDATDVAPVLVVSYSIGEVDFLLLDGQSSASGYIGPGWRPIDRHSHALTSPAPSLLLVETLVVAQTDSSSKKDVWNLIPDPVVSHYFHVTNMDRCQSYLLSSGWLQSALESDGPEHHSSYRGETDEYKESSARNEEGEWKEQPQSTCIPVFVANPRSFELRSGVDGKVSQDDSAIFINGMAVLADPFVGHVALFRTSAGMVSAVNLTVHAKLCELQTTLSSISGGSQQLNSIKQQLSQATSSESQRWRHSQQLMRKIADSLKDFPAVQASASESGAENKKVLLETAAALESNVILPMSELAQNTAFHFDILQETLQSQILVIEGPAGAPAAHSTQLSAGLSSLIKTLTDDHHALKSRVDRISARLHAQKETAELNLTLALNQRSKMTKAEAIYKQQLRDWSSAISAMGQHIETLKQLSKPALRTNESSSTAGGSPAKQQQSSHPVGLSTASPIAAQGYFPVGKYNASGSRMHNSGFSLSTSKFGSSSTVKALYDTPNGFGSPSFLTGDSRQSVPSTPVRYSGSLLETPKPPVRSLAEQQSSSFLSPGYKSQIQSMQSPARSRFTTGGSSVQRGSEASGGSHQPPAIVLNADDQVVCGELLGAQTELLRGAEEKLRSLEDRLKSLVQSRN